METKRYFFLLAILVSSCSSLTAPVTVPPHPFPSAFKQAVVSFHDLPEHWDNRHSEFVWGQGSKNTIDSGSGPRLTGSWTFDFSHGRFSMVGDTLKAQGLALVADQVNGVLTMLRLGYSHDTNDWEHSYSEDTSYGLVCQNIAYTADSSDQIVVRLSGQLLSMGLASLSYSSSNGLSHSGYGYSNSNSNVYRGTPVDSSLLTIRFIP